MSQTVSSNRPLPVEVRHPGIALGHFIDGRMLAGQSGRTGEIFDPAMGAVRGTVAYASDTETRQAIAAAAAALPAWSATPPL
jgi:malonate-semialdehyde dehydrogenase (acetylating) / methylmalonate-semialdehyde dehydrogenase